MAHRSPHQRNRTFLLALSVFPLLALMPPVWPGIVWEEGFESARCLLDWRQTERGQPTRKVFSRTDTVVHAGKLAGMLKAVHGEKVYLERELPANNGGVLTVCVYDPGYDYSGISAYVWVRDVEDREVSLGLACGHMELCISNTLLRDDFVLRREPLQWYRFQFVVDPKTPREIRCYVNGRLAGVKGWRGGSFRAIRLGSMTLRGAVCFDSITLDDDPDRIELYSGLDMMLRAPRHGAVYEDDADIPVTARLQNFADRAAEVTLTGDVIDADGKVRGQAQPRVVAVPTGRGVVETLLKFPVPSRKGRLYARAAAREGGRVVAQARRAVAVTFNPAAVQAYDGPFGIQGIGSFRRSGMREIGARCYNLWMSWPKSETEPGKIVWDPRFEKMMAEAIDDPTALVQMTFREIPKWYQAGEGWNHCVPADDKTIEDFACKAARYYREKHNVSHWSYWEEPEGYLPWSRYLQLFKAAVRGYRSGNPDVKIVGLNGTSGAYPFVEWMFKHGAGQYMDIFGHHFYTNGRPEDYGLADKLSMVRRFMRDHNGGRILPMWDTECGMYSAGLGRGLVPLSPEQVRRYKELGWLQSYYHSDSDVASWTVRKMVLGYANGLVKFFFHKSLRSFDYTYTLTALAVATLCHELSGATFARQIDLGSRSTHGYVFARDAKHFGVFWTTRNTADVTLKLAGPRVVLMDRFGNRETRPAGAGNLVQLALTEEPVYLLGITPEIEPQPEAFAVRCPTPVTSASFDVVVEALAGTRLDGRLSLELPDGWSSRPESVPCDLSGGGRTTFAVTLPWGVLKGDEVVTAVLADPAGRRLHSAQSEAVLRVVVPCRQLDRALELDGELGDWPASVRPLRVDRVEQVVLGRPLVEDTYSFSQQIARGSRFWQGPDDLSATVHTAWDEAHFYVGVDVRDNALMNDFMRNPYRGDSIEMFLDTRSPDQGFGTPSYADGVFHLRFVPPVDQRKEGRQVGYFTRQEDPLLRRRPEFIIRSGETVYSEGEGHLHNRPIPGYAAANRFRYTRTDDGYSVEFAIPFAAFRNGRPQPGQVLGFDVMLNDQDHPKEARATALCWYGNGKNSVDPSVFGRLSLEP